MSKPDDHARHDLDALLAHAGWARALAASLVHDGHRADDLVQRAWIAALEHPPGDSTPVKRWLAAVMRNFARQDVRAEKRRASREVLGARDESLPPHDDVESQAELQQMLLAAVRALDEPYRATIWARYYEGLPPRAIAARDRVPVKTVKTRLARGLTELRARFDREHGGDRRAWTALLLPFAKPPSLAGPAIGALLVNTNIKVACALIVVIGAVVVWRVTSIANPIAPQESSVAPRSPSPTVAETPSEPKLTIPGEPAREAIETPKVVHAAAPGAAPNATKRVVHGRAVDLEKRGIGGLEIVLAERRLDRNVVGSSKPTEAAVANTRPDGSFEATLPGGGATLIARGEGWVTVFAAASVNDTSGREATIFVAPRRALAGVVVDAARRPIVDAKLAYVTSHALRRDLGAVLDQAMETEWMAHADAQGHFELPDAPLAPGALEIEAVSYRDKSIEPPERPDFGLVIVLEPLEQKHLVVRGHVVDAERKPVDGAHVALGDWTVETHEDGAFAFDIDGGKAASEMEQDTDGAWRPKHRPEAIVAVKSGRLPARVDLPPLADLRQSVDIPEYTLVIGGPPLEIGGIVVDADGHAVESALVRPREETHFGMIQFINGGEGVAFSTTVENLVRGGAGSADSRTDKDGHFRVKGLLDREYTLVALDERTLRHAVSGAVHGGDRDVIVRLQSEKECVRVAGRIVSPTGNPIAEVSVHPGRAIEASAIPTFGTKVVTDAEGRFEFTKTARDGLVFQIEGPSIFLVFDWKMKAGDDPEHLEIVVSRRCHVQVDLGAHKDCADSFTIVDAHGAPVQMMSVHGAVSWMPEKVDIVDGRSEPVACEETAKTIVLRKGDQEIDRVPFTVKPNELVVVHP